MNNQLFKRNKQLIIGDQAFTDLEIDFNVSFNTDAEPTVNDVTIFNLTPETSALIKNGVEVKLNAGYGDYMGNILVGKVTGYEKSNDSKDSTHKIMVTPDLMVALSKTVSLSYAPGSLASDVLADLFREAGLSAGLMRLTNNITYENGKIITGTVQSAIVAIVKETNSFMFTRCNIIYVVEDVYELDTGYLLRPDTGLIGSPEPTDVNGSPGYKITCLLNPMLTVGSVFRLESRYVSGLFRVDNGTHSGDFTTTLNCLPTDKVSRYVPPTTTGGTADNTPKGQIWNFLINKGFSKAATAGVMGNMELESRYDPTAVNPSSGAFGLFQWTDTRQQTLRERAQLFGVDVNSIAFQMEYFYWEVTDGPENSCFPTYTSLPSLDAFKSLTDPEQAARLFENAFERSGESGMGDRIDYALAVYSWDGGGTTGGTGGGYFGPDAFKCECGCGLDCTQELKNKMEQVVAITGDLVISGPARCEYQNSITPGSSSTSLHMTGEAADCYVPGGSVDQLYNAARQVGLGTIRYYSSGFVHCQTYPADWVSD